MGLCVNFILKAVQHKEIVTSYNGNIERTMKNIKSSDQELLKKVTKIKEKLCWLFIYIYFGVEIYLSEFIN